MSEYSEIELLKTKLENIKKEYNNLENIYEQFSSKLKLCIGETDDLRKEVLILKIEVKKLYPIFADGDIPLDINADEIKKDISDIIAKSEQINIATEKMNEFRNELNLKISETEKKEISKKIKFNKPPKEEFPYETKETINNEKNYYLSVNENYKRKIAELRKKLKEVDPNIEKIQVPFDFDIAEVYKEIETIRSDIKQFYDAAEKIVRYRSSQTLAVVKELEGDKNI